MSDWILIGVVVAAALLALAIVASKKGGGSSGSVYQPAKALFSAAERSFLGVLDQAVGGEYRVFGKVRVADVVTLRSSLSPSVRQQALNRISSKHFDFVVCRTDDLSVVCAVELNDQSHSSKRAQARDAFLAEVCRGTGLPLLAVSAKRSYSVQEVREQFTSAIAFPAEQRVVA